MYKLSFLTCQMSIAAADLAEHRQRLTGTLAAGSNARGPRFSLQKGNLARSAGNIARVKHTPGKTERIANDLLSGVTLAVTSVPQVFSRPG